MRLLIFILLTTYIYGISGEEILIKLDNNITPNSIINDGLMEIKRGDRVTTKKMIISGIGKNLSFIEFIYPKRDKGTKYLRVDDNLWIYLPKANRTIKISGHMLKRSIMGSDFSYEDQTDRNKLPSIYDSKILDQNDEYYILELIGKKGEEVAYKKRLIWVNKNDYSLIKQELYAESGRLLKVMKVHENKIIGKMNYPTKISMEDMIRKDSITYITLSNIKLDVKIDEDIFTRKNLEKK